MESDYQKTNECINCGRGLEIVCESCKPYSNCDFHNNVENQLCPKCHKYPNKCTNCGLNNKSDMYCDGCDTEICLYCVRRISEFEKMRNDGKMRSGVLCYKCVDTKRTKCNLCDVILFPFAGDGCRRCGNRRYCTDHTRLIYKNNNGEDGVMERICTHCISKQNPKICDCKSESCFGYKCDDCELIICSMNVGSEVKLPYGGKKNICPNCMRNNGVECSFCIVKTHPDLMKECGMCRLRKSCGKHMHSVIIPVDKGSIIETEYCNDCYYGMSRRGKKEFSCDICRKRVKSSNLFEKTILRGIMKFMCKDCSRDKPANNIEKCLICSYQPKRILEFSQSCNKCHRYPFCKSHVHNTTELITLCGIPSIKRVQYCETCFDQKKFSLIKGKKEYAAKRIIDNKKEIDEWIANNSEWEAKKREDYMKAAEDKWERKRALLAMEKINISNFVIK